MSGLIQQCIFSNNSGGPTIYDGDLAAPPFNLLQYSGNTIFSANGSVAYDGDDVNASTVAELNQLVMHRSDGSTTIKAPPPANVAPASAPAVGALLMIPPTVLQRGAPGETLPLPSHLAYAASGGPVALDGTPQAGSAGIVPTTVNGVHTLTVGATSVSTVPPPGAALNISTRLPVGTGQSVLMAGLSFRAESKNVVIRASVPRCRWQERCRNRSWNCTMDGALIATTITGAQRRSAGCSPRTRASKFTPAGGSVERCESYRRHPQSRRLHGCGRGAGDTTGIAVVEVMTSMPIRLEAGQHQHRGVHPNRRQCHDRRIHHGRGAGATRVVCAASALPSEFRHNNPCRSNDRVHDANGALIDSNDDWRTNQAVILSTGLAPSNDAESALLLPNPAPGAYTAVLRGKNSGTGVGVVEVYVFQ